jgi:hypothetical protein
MFKKAIGTWRLFKEIEPGHRFQTRYHSHRCRREQGETSQYGWIVNLIGGAPRKAAGVSFQPPPRPSFIIIIIGMWMLAGEFIPLARFFDRLDVRLRKMKRWIKECWSSVPFSVKVLATMLSVAALGYGIYYLVSGG